LCVAQKKVIFDLADTNQWCGLQSEKRGKLLNAPDGAFCVMHYSVLIRRDPTLLLFLAVFPVFLLCLLALAIVWQSTGFTDSIANIAAVLLALFAYAPVVRSRLPPSPSVTVIDKLLNYAILVCFIVLLTAVIQEGFRQKYGLHDDNIDSIIVDAEVAKLYLARVSLISSMVITTGHVYVVSYFAYQIIHHVLADRRQTSYVQGLDVEVAEAERTAPVEDAVAAQVTRDSDEGPPTPSLMSMSAWSMQSVVSDQKDSMRSVLGEHKGVEMSSAASYSQQFSL
jgi:hypothetical protein